MNPAIDTREHLIAIRALIDAEFDVTDSGVKTYEPDDIPGSNGRGGKFPLRLAIVTTQRTQVPFRRLSAQSGRTSWRVRVLCVGSAIFEADWVNVRVTNALDEAVLRIGDLSSTRLQHENSTAPAFDDGRYSSSTVYTYTV